MNVDTGASKVSKRSSSKGPKGSKGSKDETGLTVLDGEFHFDLEMLKLEAASVEEFDDQLLETTRKLITTKLNPDALFRQRELHRMTKYRSEYLKAMEVLPAYLAKKFTLDAREVNVPPDMWKELGIDDDLVKGMIMRHITDCWNSMGSNHAITWGEWYIQLNIRRGT